MTDKKNARKYFISGAIVFVLFAIMTLLVKTVDVKAVGPLGSEIGLSGINTYFHKLIGANMTLYDITEILGYIPIAVAVFFAGFGLGQLVKRKSLKAVDSNIIILGVLLVVLACAYVFFEIVIVNYRPIIMENELEASFPSSHTMLSVTVLGAAIYQLLISSDRRNSHRTTPFGSSLVYRHNRRNPFERFAASLLHWSM